MPKLPAFDALPICLYWTALIVTATLMHPSLASLVAMAIIAALAYAVRLMALAEGRRPRTLYGRGSLWAVAATAVVTCTMLVLSLTFVIVVATQGSLLLVMRYLSRREGSRAG